MLYWLVYRHNNQISVVIEWLACSTHVYVDMNLLGKSSRKENE